jgi:hypothetical protein
MVEYEKLMQVICKIFKSVFPKKKKKWREEG